MTTTNSSLHDAPQISAKPAPGEKERCVLAYSGGLDTSVCIKWLQEEYDLDVIAVVGDLGQEHEGLEAIKAKALATGAIGTIIAPVRNWDLGCRADEIEWAAAHGVPVKATTDKPYSIDDNLWGRAIECGVLEDPWCEPPADIWTMTCDPACAPDEPTYVEIEFDQGVPCALDGTPMSFLDIIYAMNDIAGTNGYGRIDMVENRLVGVKSRECYEVPGGLALIQAHKALEDLCLERGVLHHKLAIEQTWAEQVYNGLWFSPLKEAFDAFLAHTQQCVSGTVKLKFFKGSCTVVGRKSTYSLYDFGLATYDADDAFDHQAAKGFIDIHGLSCKVWAKNRLATGARMPSYDDVNLANTAYGKMSAVVEEAEEILEDADAALA